MDKCKHFTDSIFYQFEQTAKYCRFLGMQVFKKLQMPLTADEFYALDILIIKDNICQRELAQIILKDRPATGRILDSLEQKGLIQRYADTKNNRLVRRVKITEEGRVLAEEISQKLKDYISKIPKVFTDEDKQKLIDLMNKFRKSLEEEIEMKI